MIYKTSGLKYCRALDCSGNRSLQIEAFMAGYLVVVEVEVEVKVEVYSLVHYSIRPKPHRKAI